MNWYYTENNQQRGPVSQSEFDQLVREGRITPETLVWCEGMAAWQPYREMAPGAGPLPLPVNPAAAQLAGISMGVPQRDGPPWEHRATLGFFNAIVETIKGVLFDPVTTFSRMNREGGLAAPLTYGLLVGGVGAYVALVYRLLMQSVQGSVITQNSNHFNTAFSNYQSSLHFTGVALIMVLFASLFLVPVFLAICAFINSGILHLCLMLLGGARQPFETTFRVVCYSFGSAAIFQLIPLCGGVIGGVWNIVVTCIGIAKAHEISTGKAVLAVLLPMICCCAVILAVIVLTVGLAAFSVANHH